MKFELNITAGQVISVIAIALICFGAGYLLPKEKQIEISMYDGFTEKDINSLQAISYFSGHCERMGLVSTVLIQDFNGQPYGLPVCVEGAKNE